MPVQAQSTTALNSETAVTVSDTNTNYALPEPHCDVLAAACEQLSIG